MPEGYYITPGEKQRLQRMYQWQRNFRVNGAAGFTNTENACTISIAKPTPPPATVLQAAGTTLKFFRCGAYYSGGPHLVALEVDPYTGDVIEDGEALLGPDDGGLLLNPNSVMGLSTNIVVAAIPAGSNFAGIMPFIQVQNYGTTAANVAAISMGSNVANVFEFLANGTNAADINVLAAPDQYYVVGFAEGSNTCLAWRHAPVHPPV